MKTIQLHEYEIDALIVWHRDQQYETANKEKYDEAKEHRDRALMLVELLKVAENK